MCGIAGILSTSGAPVAERDLAPMLLAQAHRGPDASGAWSDDLCALGHRRLAIIDLSEGGRQPLSNEDGSVWITFNGEVYNFQSLRQELEGLGHAFRTGTDTEAIVHAYEQWGTDCVRRLRGMFAFVIWDAARRRLFVARDRAGKKPLYYTRHGSRFLFASELQGLLADPEVPRSVHPPAIDAYLTWGYVPGPATAFRGIYKLEPAHWLTVDLTPEGPVVHRERYWSLEYLPKLSLTEGEAVEALREQLTEAVRLRMISDVPLGAFLSGGIDSSVVVGLMAGLSSRPVKTFSVGFQEAAYSELAHAKRIAERWGTEHQEFVVEADAVSILPMLVRHFGEPYADESAIPTYYLSQLTRQHVTVALNGDGGDETFLGYERYRANRLAERLRAVPGSALATAAVRALVPASAGRRSALQKVRRFAEVAGEPMPRRYGRWISGTVGGMAEAEKEVFYGEALQPLLRERLQERWFEGLFQAAAAKDPMERAAAVDHESYLPYDLLAKVDIATMATSLEARSPLLDHEVMGFAAHLPTEMKVPGGQLKHLLKRAFADLLPEENRRRGKMGFGVPVGEWFRGPLHDLLRDALLGSGGLSAEWLRPEPVRRLVDDHLGLRADHSLRLWNLLMLELWHREVARQPAAAHAQ